MVIRLELVKNRLDHFQITSALLFLVYVILFLLGL